MRAKCARVLAAALMTGAIGFALAMPAFFGTPNDVTRLLTAPPSSLQGSVRAVAPRASARSTTEAERLAGRASLTTAARLAAFRFNFGPGAAGRSGSLNPSSLGRPPKAKPKPKPAPSPSPHPHPHPLPRPHPRRRPPPSRRPPPRRRLTRASSPPHRLPRPQQPRPPPSIRTRRRERAKEGSRVTRTTAMAKATTRWSRPANSLLPPHRLRRLRPCRQLLRGRPTTSPPPTGAMAATKTKTRTGQGPRQ